MTDFTAAAARNGLSASISTPDGVVLGCVEFPTPDGPVARRVVRGDPTRPQVLRLAPGERLSPGSNWRHAGVEQVDPFEVLDDVDGGHDAEAFAAERASLSERLRLADESADAAVRNVAELAAQVGRLTRQLEATEVSPAPAVPAPLLGRMRALGFVPGEGDPLAWLVQQAEGNRGPKHATKAAQAAARVAVSAWKALAVPGKPYAVNVVAELGQFPDPTTRRKEVLSRVLQADPEVVRTGSRSTTRYSLPPLSKTPPTTTATTKTKTTASTTTATTKTTASTTTATTKNPATAVAFAARHAAPGKRYRTPQLMELGGFDPPRLTKWQRELFKAALVESGLFERHGKSAGIRWVLEGSDSEADEAPLDLRSACIQPKEKGAHPAVTALKAVRVAHPGTHRPKDLEALLEQAGWEHGVDGALIVADDYDLEWVRSWRGQIVLKPVAA